MYCYVHAGNPCSLMKLIEMLDDHVMKNLFYRMNSKDDLQANVQYMYIKHKCITKSAIFI